MDEKQYELVEIQVDAELLEQLEKIIAPMGLTPEMLIVKFFEFCADPATQELAISLLLKWKAEQEAERGESGRGTLMLSKETFCEALRKIQAQKDRDEQFSKALTLMGDGHFVFEGGAPLLAALLDVLKEAVNDQYDYISWWLYDAAPDYEVWTDDEKTKWCLKEPEALYDFIRDECQG